MTDRKMKLQKSFRRLAVAAVLLAAAGCSTTPLIQDKIDELPPDRIELLPTGSEVRFVMTFNESWALSVDGSWLQCSVPDAKGKRKEGTYVIVVSGDVNRSGAVRTGKVTFTLAGGQTRSIPVTQDNPYLRLRILDQDDVSQIQNDSIRFKWNDSAQAGFTAFPVFVESNVDWRFNLAEDYGSTNFRLSETSGFGDKTLTLTPVANNLDRRAFESMLTLDAYMPGTGASKIGTGVESYSYRVYQKNLRFLINDLTDDPAITVDELNKSVTNGELLIDSELPWTVSGSTDWVRLSINGDEAGESTLSVQADGVNPSLTERSCDVVLRSQGGAERTLHVRQLPYVFSLDKTSVTIGNHDTAQQAISLQTTGTWEVTNIPDWLTVTPMEGDGAASIMVSCAEQNLNLEDNVISLHIASKLNSISRDAWVRQDKFLFEVVPDETLGKIPTLSTQLYDTHIVSSGEWSISADKEWVGISDNSGTGEKTIQVGATSANPDMDADRSSVITLVSETHKAKGIDVVRYFDVVQRKFIFNVSVEKTTVPAYSKKKLRLNIECSGNWKLGEGDYPSWLIPDKTSGEFDGYIDFSIGTYTDKNKTRSGSVKVTSVYNNQVLQTPTIVQDKFVFEIDKNSFYGLPPVDVPAQAVVLKSTEEAGWTIESSASWLPVPSSSGNGGTTLLFSLPDNPQTSSRAGSATIKSSVTGESFTVSFSQNRYEFYVLESTFSYSELDASQKTLHVQCSSNWTIDMNGASWIHASPSSGKGDTDVKLTLDNNVALQSRSADIIVYSNLQHNTGGELSKQIRIQQDAYKFDASGVSKEYNAYLTSPEVLDVPVTCSGRWSVSVPSGQSWISASPMSGSGNGSVRITTVANTTLEQRSLKVTIASTDNPALKKEVSIAQKAFVFNVTATGNSLSASGGTCSCSVDCSAGWSVSCSDTWFRADPSGGTGAGTVLITVDKNTTKADRTGTLTFTSVYGHTRTVTISQSK